MNQTNAQFVLSPYPFSGPEREPKTKFRSDDEIYGKVILPKSAGEYFGVTSNEDASFISYTVSVSQNGKPLPSSGMWSWMHLSEADRKQSVLIVDVLPSGFNTSTRVFEQKDLTSGLTSQNLGWIFGRLKLQTSGSYKVTLTLSNGSATVETSFDFEFNSKDLSLMLKKAASGEETIKAGIHNYVQPSAQGLPFEWNQKQGEILSGVDIGKIKSLVVAKSGPDAQFVKFNVQPSPYSDWIIENGDSGQPQRKYHHQVIFAICENNGRYSFIEGHLQQDYSSNSFQSIYFNIIRTGEYTSSKPFRVALGK